MEDSNRSPSVLKKAGRLESVSPKVWKKDWVVDCEPVGNGHSVLKYLAPYIYRIALSNNRLVSLQNGQITFRFKDGASGQWQPSTLPALEFIRRFLQHVLPHGFVKVRYYGFLSSRHRPSLQTIRDLLGVTPAEPSPDLPADPQATAPSLAEPAPPCCPRCGRVMTLLERLSPATRAPP